MPTIQGIDQFFHNSFSVPGGGPYGTVTGTPVLDTSIKPPLESAAVLLDNPGTGDVLGYTVSGTPARAWCGFYFRMATGSATSLLIQFATVGGNVARLYYDSGAAFLATIDEINYEYYAITLDEYQWVEMIYDASGTTHNLYTRIAGVDGTSVPRAGTSASTISNFTLTGPAFGNQHRFAHVMWGSAASTSDWLGEPTTLRSNTIYEGGVDGAIFDTFGNSPPDTTFDLGAGVECLYTTVQAHSGTRSIRWVAPNPTGVAQTGWSGFGSLTSNVWQRFYMFLPALPADNNFYPAAFRTGADTFCAGLRILSSGSGGIVTGRDASNSSAGCDGSVAVATGQWVRIEWRVLPGVGGTGTMNWRLFNDADSTTASDSNGSTGLTLGANINRNNVGFNVAVPAAGLTVYFDDIAVSTEGWIGPALVEDVETEALPQIPGMGAIGL